MARKPNENATPDVVVETPVVEVVAPAKGAKISISASFKITSKDGDRILYKFAGEGATVAEALSDVKGSDEEQVDVYNRPFPDRQNTLVNVKVKKGTWEFNRAVAPHVAQEIFVKKNVALASKLLGL